MIKTLPPEWLKEKCCEIGLVVTAEMLEKMDVYAAKLLEWNEKMNLTAITSPNEIAEKHFLDSLTLFKYVDFPQGRKLIDVGTGAGFPGMVIKIFRPDIEVTLLDSLNKRLIFLQNVADTLDFKVNMLHLRAEDAGHDQLLRESFDIAVSRAVARLPALCEYCLPLVKAGGQMCAMKGPEGETELQEAASAIKILGGAPGTVETFNLPSGDTRTIVNINKISQTPLKYPRQGVKITKKPL